MNHLYTIRKTLSDTRQKTLLLRIAQAKQGNISSFAKRVRQIAGDDENPKQL